MPRGPKIQRRFLLRSRWTAAVPLAGSDGERHYEVIVVERDRVTLRAVLTRRDHQLPIAALDDASAWTLGWQSLADEP